MRNDHLTYRRATSISVFGLVLQLALGVALLLYGLFGSDTAAISGALIVLYGGIIWLGLALIFHQHALERIEAFETEALESQGAFESSVFEGARDEMRVAARRVEWMHRFLLPTLSLLYAAALISTGVVRFLGEGSALKPETPISSGGGAGWAIAIGVGLAAAGFVFARFVAGMAKQKEWSNLRSGAAASVGASIVGLLVAIAHFLQFLDAPLALRYLHVVMPAIMVVLGVEVILNFVLNLYRPRRKGEAPRPAFESRILSFFAAPDRLAESVGEAISYQFGFDVTQSWFYRLLSRTLGLLFICGGLVLWGLSAVAIVQPNQQGLILRFGSLQRQVGPGAHFKYPWPVETLETYPASSITELEVGSHPPHGNDPILWTNDHLGAGHRESYYIVQPSVRVNSDLGPRDISLVAVEAPVHFVIEDLAKYDALAEPASRQTLLESVAERTVMEYLGSRAIDEILGAGRTDISDELRTRLQAAFDGLDAGVRVVFAGIVGAHPPQNNDVAKAYERVTSSEQRREKSIEDARTTRIQTLTKVVASVERSEAIVRELDALEAMQQRNALDTDIAEKEIAIESLLREAGGEAAQLILAARADRWRLHMNERARVARQDGRVALFRAAPQTYLAIQWFEAIHDMLTDSRVYVTTFDQSRVRVNVEDEAAIGGTPTLPAMTPKE